MATPCFTIRAREAAEALNVSPATIWNKINRGELAFFRDGGLTLIVNDWPGEPPAREGRAPSIREYINEGLARMTANPQPKKAVPEGVHRGRPRKRRAGLETERQETPGALAALSAE